MHLKFENKAFERKFLKINKEGLTSKSSNNAQRRSQTEEKSLVCKRELSNSILNKAVSASSHKVKKVEIAADKYEMILWKTASLVQVNSVVNIVINV